MTSLSDCGSKHSNVAKCAVPWSPDHQVMPPASWLNGGLNMKTKSSAAPVLSSSYYSKNGHRHPLLPQTQRINTALVKVDPLKFTLRELRQDWGSLQALHKEQELHFNSELCHWTWLSCLSEHSFYCLLCFFQNFAWLFLIKSRKNTLNNLWTKPQEEA